MAFGGEYIVKTKNTNSELRSNFRHVILVSTGSKPIRRYRMRSELIFGATTYISSRYLLVKLASKAARKLHRPNTRIQDTTNDAFARFALGKANKRAIHST